jgi:UDP-N-acetyl-D-glucosamine dehydrogenase
MRNAKTAYWERATWQRPKHLDEGAAMGQQPSVSVVREVQAARTAVGIVGLGIVGSVSARLAAQAGYRVLGYDSNPARARQIRLELGADFDDASCEIASAATVLSDADVIVLAVRAATGPDGVTDLDPLLRAWQAVADLPARDRLILVETTVPPGTTRKLAARLPAASRAITQVAHCPERLRVGDSLDQLRKVPRLVGGLTPAATRRGCDFIQSLGIPAVPVTQPEVAELAKLLENAFLTTGIAFMGEVARLALALDISAAEVADAAATKPHGYYPFRPGAAIGGHCLINDMRMLSGAAASLGIASDLIDGVQHAADRLNDNVVARLQALLAKRHMPLSEAQIWIIGVGFKLGSDDASGSAAFGLVRLLRQRGCSVVFSDSKIESLTVDDVPVARAPLASTAFRPHAALLLSGDPTVGLEDVAARCRLVLDLGGSQIMQGRACNIERI